MVEGLAPGQAAGESDEASRGEWAYPARAFHLFSSVAWMTRRAPRRSPAAWFGGGVRGAREQNRGQKVSPRSPSGHSVGHPWPPPPLAYPSPACIESIRLEDGACRWTNPRSFPRPCRRGRRFEPKRHGPMCPASKEPRCADAQPRRGQRETIGKSPRGDGARPGSKPDIEPGADERGDARPEPHMPGLEILELRPSLAATKRSGVGYRAGR